MIIQFQQSLEILWFMEDNTYTAEFGDDKVDIYYLVWFILLFLAQTMISIKGLEAILTNWSHFPFKSGCPLEISSDSA